METIQPDLVCVSHLWWEWVWQRPQHILSRFAKNGRVFYVEEPRIEIGPHSEGFEVAEKLPNLHAATLVYRSDPPKFWERLNQTLDRAGAHPFKVSENIKQASLMFESPVQGRLEQEVKAYVASWRKPGAPLVLWLYTPVVSDFIDLLAPDLVVYDVMDELSAFKFAAERLKRQERELLERADLVFCGGPSMWESKRRVRPDAHLFPSGVEQQHFARALDPDLPVPEDMRDIGSPIVGFFGVIDERSDLDLLAKVAAARPDWSWVMIGPVLKIEERNLPRLPNLHYLGKKQYEQLPAYLKVFDVAMMPFALNEATRFISPTKTLEYLAAHKPVVSTSVPDVISMYGSVVRIADGPQEFVRAVDAALNERDSEREQRINQENELLGRYSWDRLAVEMDGLVRDKLRQALSLGG